MPLKFQPISVGSTNGMSLGRSYLFFRPIADCVFFFFFLFFWNFFFAVPEMTSPFTRLYRHKHNEICPLKAEKWINTYRHLHSACWMLHTLTCLLNTKSRLHNTGETLQKKAMSFWSVWVKKFKKPSKDIYLLIILPRILDSGCFVAFCKW